MSEWVSEWVTWLLLSADRISKNPRSYWLCSPVTGCWSHFGSKRRRFRTRLCQNPWGIVGKDSTWTFINEWVSEWVSEWNTSRRAQGDTFGLLVTEMKLLQTASFKPTFNTVLSENGILSKWFSIRNGNRVRRYLGTMLLPSRIESNNGNSSDGDSLTPPNFLPMYTKCEYHV